MPIFLVVGIVVGCLGTAYNQVLLGTLAASERIGNWWSVETRAALVGALVGLVAWFGPGIVGGGDVLTQRALTGGDSMLVVGSVFLIRFGLGPVSYAAGAPGGLFAPMLVLGAQSGLVLGTLFAAVSPHWPSNLSLSPLLVWRRFSLPWCAPR